MTALSHLEGAVKHLLNDTAEECVDTVLHTAFHGYQYYLCNAFLEMDESYRDLRYFSRVEKYCNEFPYYPYGITYEQACEEDAREYAKARYDDYARELGLWDEGEE